MDLIEAGLFLPCLVEQLFVNALLERVHAGCLLLLQLVLMLSNQKQSVLFLLLSFFQFSLRLLLFILLHAQQQSLSKLLFMVSA